MISLRLDAKYNGYLFYEITSRFLRLPHCDNDEFIDEVNTFTSAKKLDRKIFENTLAFVFFLLSNYNKFFNKINLIC